MIYIFILFISILSIAGIMAAINDDTSHKKMVKYALNCESLYFIKCVMHDPKITKEEWKLLAERRLLLEVLEG